MDWKGVRSTQDDDREPTWDDYIQALRQEGRRFRPASLHNRPQASEREAGKLQAAQYDLFASPQGRAATRLSEMGSRGNEGSASEGSESAGLAARLSAARGGAGGSARGIGAGASSARARQRAVTATTGIKEYRTDSAGETESSQASETRDKAAARLQAARFLAWRADRE